MAGRKSKLEQKGQAFDFEKGVVLYLQKVAATKSLTTYQIAEASGIDQGQVSRILSGSKTPTLATIFKLAAVLGVALKLETQGVLIPVNFLPPNWVDETPTEMDFPAEIE